MDITISGKSPRKQPAANSLDANTHAYDNFNNVNSVEANDKTQREPDVRAAPRERQSSEQHC